MSDTPAIAVLELSTLSQGTFVADAMTKRAQLAHMRIGSVQPGKFIILIGGEVGPVQESCVEGLPQGGEALCDHIVLPDVHPQVAESVLGVRRAPTRESLGVFECQAIPATVGAADKAVKAAEVDILEIRLGDGLGGRGVTYLCGRIHDVQAGLEAALQSFESSGHHATYTVIPAAHADIMTRLAASTRFGDEGAGGPVSRGSVRMLVGRIIGTVVPSAVYEGLESVPMLIVQPLDSAGAPKGQPVVAADSTRMAGPGETVTYEGGREAALALDPWFVPVDHTIVNIVDEIRTQRWGQA